MNLLLGFMSVCSCLADRFGLVVLLLETISPCNRASFRQFIKKLNFFCLACAQNATELRSVSKSQ